MPATGCSVRRIIKIMAQNKTTPGKASVTAFIKGIEDSQRRSDTKKVAAMMRKATGSRAKMWGASIIGFGSYHYRYDSGREGDFMITGLSPRKQALTVYIMPGFSHFQGHMKQLGRYKTGKSCLYIKRLADVDEKVLNRLIVDAVKYMRRHYETK